MAEIDDTAPQRAMTNYDVFVALSERHDQSDQLAAERHRTLVNEIDAIKGTLLVHDKRIAAVERRDAPRSQTFALIAIACGIWVGALLFFMLLATIYTHAPAAHLG